MIPKRGEKVILSLSGGMDSTTLLGLLLDKGVEAHCCIFSYGAKHNRWETIAAKVVIDYYRGRGAHIIVYEIDISNITTHFKSNLLLSGEQIPEGHYHAETMRKTVVPGRNTIFASIMAGLAESQGAEYVALGVHAGDHYIYPDCRPEYVKALDTLIYLSSDKRIQLFIPFLYDSKVEILRKGIGNIPYHLTRTCYKDQPLACGKCGSCTERLEAFEILGIRDPIEYDNTTLHS